MPYLLLAFGVLLGIYGLYRFFLSANVHQIVALFTVGAFIVVCAALFFLALTGRLPAALGLLVALWPLGLHIWHNKKGPRVQNEGHQPPPSSTPMSHAEALEILGLSEGATPQDIKDAHKKLIKKTHPDQEGSAWLAAKINQARDTLLN